MSPLIPKVIAWRMLISLEKLKSLHRMDNFLLATHDSLIGDPSFASVFEVRGEGRLLC